MNKICALVIFTFSISLFSFSQLNVFPTNWWVGMKHNKIQLLVQREEGNQFPDKIISSTNYAGVSILKTTLQENKRYATIDIVIAATAKVGIASFTISAPQSKEKINFNFELKKKREGRGTAFAQGVNSKDFIYLLMPERFSNGDKSNDIVDRMLDQTLDRDSIYLRHGGDLQGVINHVDYLKNLGVTTLWMTPVIENNQPNRTEHGYAFTNHYSIDPRLGGAEAYKRLSDELHKNGMKLIQDAVYNHVGHKHILFTDPPAKSWWHQWDKFTKTSYKDQPLFDPYASKADFKISQDGWFTEQMPDWNHANHDVEKFLIQHAIWSVEEFGVDGWRIDTYVYNDLHFMNRCNQALMNEYPKMTMFGETWLHGVPSQAYFVENNINAPFKSNLQAATDFQTLFYGINPALNEKFGWTEGVNKLYNTLAFDYLYKDPTRNVIFLDNHDLPRSFTNFGEDFAKMKMAFSWLLTCRGIPQMYYGAEVLMKGGTNPDGWVRLDFPGGWEGDFKNAFTGENLNPEEQNMQDHIKTLANYRKNSSALQTGKMMQYVPKDGLYVYFRYDNKQTIMCIMNTSEEDKQIKFGDYAERTKNIKIAKDILSGNIIEDNFAIPAKTMWVLELGK
ncbi:MAG: cyclomaltodextrinase C-terminal domain-containing protein [Chitinophagaceae bacterium]|nr:cyclomaltodextrinase C-terminal domain-containing protein [Chitinophagaceae bacterium]